MPFFPSSTILIIPSEVTFAAIRLFLCRKRRFRQQVKQTLLAEKDHLDHHDHNEQSTGCKILHPERRSEAGRARYQEAQREKTYGYPCDRPATAPESNAADETSGYRFQQ